MQKFLVEDGNASAQNAEQDFSSSLSALIGRHLKSEIYNSPNSPSRVMASLLETIHTLQCEVDRLGATLETQDVPTTSINSTTQSPHFILLHRVFCSKAEHGHHVVTYEDAPQFDQDVGWSFDKVLRGRRPIFNLETFLIRQPTIQFVVFKEYTCVEGNESIDGSPRATADEILSISERRERIRIVSPDLQRAILRASDSNESPELHQGRGILQMDSPYAVLFHCQKELAVMAESDRFANVLTPLLTYLKENYGDDYEEAREVFLQGRVSVRHLSKLFHSSQLVIASSPNPNAVRAGILIESNIAGDGTVTLRGWYWAYDGDDLLRKGWIGTVAPLSVTETDITNLAIYPFSYAPENIKDRLTRRARRVRRMPNKSFVAYDGWDATEAREFQVSFGCACTSHKGCELTAPLSGTRFVIDNLMYRDLHGPAPAKAVEGDGPFKPDTENYDTRIDLHDKKQAWLASLDRETSETMGLAVPVAVTCFQITEKRWFHLYLDGLEQIDWDEKAFSNLVLEESTKELIYASVRRPLYGDIHEEKLTQQTSNGMYILLHGPPGVGKTLTAASVAEIHERPLIRISGGEVGTEPEAVEKYMSNVMHMCRRWDCILLLEEADDFLEDRIVSDVRRNAIASVFLGILDGFDGIMFLTTNRLGSFDQAFRSRIHLTFRYTELDENARKKIWNHFIMTAEWPENRIDKWDLELHSDELYRYELNGREIRNAVMTARRLARERGEHLETRHIFVTLNAKLEFQKYLRVGEGWLERNRV